MVGHGLKGDQALWECLDHDITLFIAIDQRIVGVPHCAVASGNGQIGVTIDLHLI